MDSAWEQMYLSYTYNPWTGRPVRDVSKMTAEQRTSYLLANYNTYGDYRYRYHPYTGERLASETTPWDGVHRNWDPTVFYDDQSSMTDVASTIETKTESDTATTTTNTSDDNTMYMLIIGAAVLLYLFSSTG